MDTIYDRLKQMIKSDDSEIAILGAKLLLQENPEKALIIQSKFWMDFYKDKNGEFHIVRALNFDSHKGYIHILSENEINTIVKYSDSHYNVDNKVINLIKQEYEQREATSEHNI